MFHSLSGHRINSGSDYYLLHFFDDLDGSGIYGVLLWGYFNCRGKIEMKYHVIIYLFNSPNFVELESGRCRLQPKVVSVQQILLHHVEVANHEESETSFNKTADFSPHILGYLYEGLRKYSFF